MFTLAVETGRPRTRQTADENGLVTQFARTDPRKYSFAVRTVESWNKLPEEIKKAGSKGAFKTKMKRWKAKRDERLL